MTFSELQTLVNARRKAQGLPVKPLPDSIKIFEEQIVRYQAQRDQAIKDKKTLQEISDIDKSLEPAKRRLQHEIQKYQGR